MIPAYLSALLLLTPAAIIGMAVRLATRNRRRAGDGPASVRRFFQYALLFYAAAVVGEGISLLLAEWWPAAPRVAEPSGQSRLARATAQVIIGLPLLAAVGAWVRRTVRSPRERSAAAPNVYLIGMSLTGLGAAAYGAYRLAEAATGLAGFRPADATNLAVWGTVWLLHFRIAARARHAGPLRAGAFLGAWAGLWITGWGAWRMTEQLLGLLYREAGGTVPAADLRESVLRAAFAMVIGGLIWVRYWATIVSGWERDRIWRGAALLGGTLAGLATALAGAGRLTTLGLEWLLGAAAAETGRHFAPVPGALSLVIVGTAVWSYTGRAARPGRRRDEADRLYDYAGAGLGCAGTVAGAAIGLSALAQWALPGGATEGDWRLGLAGGMGLLAVAVPLWLRFWSRAQRRRAKNPDLELSSPVRRAYVTALCGAGGLAALGSLLTAVFPAVDDIANGLGGWGTLDRTRTSLAVLLTAGAAARYHQLVRRSDRLRAPEEPHPGVMMAVLVSAAGATAAREAEKQTGVRMWVWDSPQAGTASAEEIIAILDQTEGQRILIAVDESGHRVIPFAPA